MKTQFHIRGFKADNALQRQLLGDLEGLDRELPIESAEVVLQRERETNPPFKTVVMLEVPGPDIHAAARDHTAQAAWLKVLARLREQIQARKSRQTARRKERREFHTAVGNRPAATVASKL